MRRQTNKKPAIKDRNTLVVNSIYEALKKMNQPALYPALRKRVTDLLTEIDDPDQVELVCLTIIDDTYDFSTWKDFNWVFFEYTRDSLEIPDGAWKYALWAYNARNELQRDINYWLGAWLDADQDGDKKAVEKARNGLEALWLKHNAREVDESWQSQNS